MMREVLDESLVEVNKPKEGLYFLLVVRDRPFCHSRNFYWVHFNRVVRDDHPEVLYLGLLKLTLVRLQEQLVFLKQFQDSSCDLPMLFKGLHENEDVIQIHHHYSFHNEFSENVVHHGLEGGRTVSEAEEHHQWLKQSVVGAEGGLPFIPFFHVDVIETPSDIQLCEVSCPSEFLYQLGDEREWVLVLHCDGIQGTVVLHQVEGSIFLFDEEDRRGHRGFGRLDVAGL